MFVTFDKINFIPVSIINSFRLYDRTEDSSNFYKLEITTNDIIVNYYFDKSKDDELSLLYSFLIKIETNYSKYKTDIGKLIDGLIQKANPVVENHKYDFPLFPSSKE